MSFVALPAAAADVAAPVAPAPVAPGECRGSVLAIGGAIRDDNTEVWSRLVQAAGGAGARIVVFTTSSSDPARTGRTIAAQIGRHGGVAEVLDLPPASPLADDPALSARVREAGGAFFSGGEQSRLLDTLQPGGRATAVLEALRALHCRGGVVAGSSAGAAVMSAVAFRDGPEPLEALKTPGRLRDNGALAGLGLGFLPLDVIVDQHFVKRGRIGRLLPLLLARGATLGLGVEEDSALAASGRVVEVLGSRGVLVVDTRDVVRDARHEDGQDAATEPFAVRGVRLSWLERGDRLDLVTRAVTPSGSNAPRPLPSARQGVEHFADMLGDNVIVEAMTRLVHLDRAEVGGLAFAVRPAADDPAPQLGFEWRLSADARTRYWRGRGDTIVDVRLDVAPVRIAAPLATPWPALRR